jgi:GNAT superfamily N-acetyltransferase
VRDVDFEDPAAVALREAMSAEMRLRYWNRLAVSTTPLPGMIATADEVLWTGVAEDADGFPVGHVALRGAWLPGELDTVELKRMYVVPSHRGAGVASALLAAVDEAALRLGARRIVLQTGDRQPDAVRLYERSGYGSVPIFPPYESLAHSRCFAKRLPVVRRVGRG